ncbi:MAG TPA: hypothetical protein VF692_13700 [Pyrinomonadaceae bacterium]|jgi:hypothetical protein
MNNENQNVVNLALTVENAELLLKLIGYPLEGQCYHIAKSDKEYTDLKSIHSELQAEWKEKKPPFSYRYEAKMFKENDL